MGATKTGCLSQPGSVQDGFLEEVAIKRNLALLAELRVSSTDGSEGYPLPLKATLPLRCVQRISLV